MNAGQLSRDRGGPTGNTDRCLVNTHAPPRQATAKNTNFPRNPKRQWAQDSLLSLQPEDDSGGDADGGHEGVRASVVTGADTPPVLEPAEHVLDIPFRIPLII